MPPQLAWLGLLLGLAAIIACLVLPREIGREDEPVLNLHVDLPPVEELVDRARQLRFTGRRRAPQAAPARPSIEPVPAMGAQQPTLAEARNPLLPRQQPGAGPR